MYKQFIALYPYYFHLESRTPDHFKGYDSTNCFLTKDVVKTFVLPFWNFRSYMFVCVPERRKLWESNGCFLHAMSVLILCCFANEFEKYLNIFFHVVLIKLPENLFKIIFIFRDSKERKISLSVLIAFTVKKCKWLLVSYLYFFFFYLGAFESVIISSLSYYRSWVKILEISPLELFRNCVVFSLDV